MEDRLQNLGPQSALLGLAADVGHQLLERAGAAQSVVQAQAQQQVELAPVSFGRRLRIDADGDLLSLHDHQFLNRVVDSTGSSRSRTLSRSIPNALKVTGMALPPLQTITPPAYQDPKTLGS